ncbi:MFS transporter [Amnibacterium endophyticum]|uniref:MFS transporter n=1 Tax=Amnibacterium endophyticum TaxID=2109337 RepID=A0ABW4LKC1_9MICO
MTTATAGRDRVLWPLAAWFWALQFAVLNPILAVLLVTLYGASDAQTGLALAAYNLGGFLASLVIPAAADRRGDYLRPLLLCGASGVALIGALAVVPALPFAVVALVLLGGPPGVGSTLLFAQLRHSGASPERVVRTRAIVSFAWVVGPVLATAVTSAFSPAAALVLLAATAAVNLATALLLLRSRRRAGLERPAATGASPLAALARLRTGRPLLVVGAFTVLQATNVATVTIAGLYVARSLQAPIVWAGVALGAAALLEIPALLLVGRLVGRRSARALVVAGCVAGTLYYALVAVAPNPVVFVALQPLNAVFFAVVAGVGLTVFQDVFHAPGIASGLFTNTRRIGAVLASGLIAAAAVAPDTYRAVYASGAAATLAVLVGVLVLRLRRPARS